MHLKNIPPEGNNYSAMPDRSQDSRNKGKDTLTRADVGLGILSPTHHEVCAVGRVSASSYKLPRRNLRLCVICFPAIDRSERPPPLCPPPSHHSLVCSHSYTLIQLVSHRHHAAHPCKDIVTVLFSPHSNISHSQIIFLSIRPPSRISHMHIRPEASWRQFN